MGRFLLLYGAIYVRFKHSEDVRMIPWDYDPIYHIKMIYRGDFLVDGDATKTRHILVVS